MLHWKVKSRGPEGTNVLLFGEITEAVSFGELKLLRGRVVLDLAGVKRINSFGVRELLNFLDDLRRQGCSLEGERCSTVVVTQLNMLPEFCRRLKVRSFLAPLECPKCDSEREITLDMPRVGAIFVPRTLCDDCQTEMVLAEPEERYFAFATGSVA